jgi:hypothetical protein
LDDGLRTKDIAAHSGSGQVVGTKAMGQAVLRALEEA